MRWECGDAYPLETILATIHHVVHHHDRAGRQGIANADGTWFEDDPPRFTKLVRVALKPLARSTDAMVDAAHAAVEIDDYFAINSRADLEARTGDDSYSDGRIGSGFGIRTTGG